MNHFLNLESIQSGNKPFYVESKHIRLKLIRVSRHQFLRHEQSSMKNRPFAKNPERQKLSESTCRTSKKHWIFVKNKKLFVEYLLGVSPAH